MYDAGESIYRWCERREMPRCHRSHLLLRAAAIRLELSDHTAFAAAAYLTQDNTLTVEAAGADAGGAAAVAEAGVPPEEHAATPGDADAAPADCESRVAACLFVASKVCEQPRRARDVVNAVYRVVHGQLLRDAREYWLRKASLLTHEQRLLRALGFDLIIAHPHPLLYHYLHALDAPPPLASLAAALVNDSASSARCGARPARLIACAAIALADALIGPASAEAARPPERWWLALGVSDQSLAAAAADLARSYRLQPSDGQAHTAVQEQPPPAGSCQAASLHGQVERGTWAATRL